MPNLFLLAGAFRAPQTCWYTRPSTKRPYSTLALVQSTDYPSPRILLFSRAVCLLLSPDVPTVSCGPGRQGGGGPESQAVDPGCRLRSRRAGHGPVGPRTRPAGRSLLPPSPPRFLAEPTLFLHTNNEKRKTLNECAVK